MKEENLGYAKCLIRQMQWEISNIQFCLDSAAALLDTVGGDCNTKEIADAAEEIRNSRKDFNRFYRTFQAIAAK